MGEEKRWKEILVNLISGKELDRHTTSWVMDQVMDGNAGDIRLSAFLAALAAKGPTVSEVRGLADSMQQHATALDVCNDAVDIVGTGGDGAKTVNISTMASLVIAACDVPVVKHGNRAASSACGAADVIEKLGVNLDITPARVAQIFEELGITFCFANLFHPAMRFAAGVRRGLGIPTVFNILGPLTNPGSPRACAVGVYDRKAASLVAGVFAQRGNSALVFRGLERGLDELTTCENNEIWHVENGQVVHTELDAVRVFGLAAAELTDLVGADTGYNAQVARDLLAGKTGPVRDTVLINAAAGIVAYGKLEGTRASDGVLFDRLKNGLEIAAAALDAGAPSVLLDKWVKASQREF